MKEKTKVSSFRAPVVLLERFGKWHKERQLSRSGALRLAIFKIMGKGLPGDVDDLLPQVEAPRPSEDK